MASIDTSHIAGGGLRVAVAKPEMAHLQLRIRREAGYETAVALSPPSPLYYECGPKGTARRLETHREEMVFAFLDFEPPDRLQLVIEFESELASGDWCVNDWADLSAGTVKPVLKIPASALQRWENTVYVRGSNLAVRDVFFAVDIGADHEKYAFDLCPMHRPWKGRIELVGPKGLIADEPVAYTRDTPFAESVSIGDANQGPPSSLPEKLRAAVCAVLDSRVTDPASPFTGGFHLIYDRHMRSYRLPHWIWAWGPAVKLLLDAVPYLDPSEGQGLLDAASVAGQTSLDFFIDDPDHIAHDISTVRWYSALGTPSGSIQYASLADSLFLAGWGWIPLYHATGDDRYLEASTRLARKAECLLNEYRIPPQDYVFECDKWTPHTLDESGFAMAGFEGLYRATKAPWVREVGTRFIDRHLETMLAAGPFWHRIYRRGEARGFGDPDVKGHAWIMDAYLSAHGLTGDQRYLDLAIQLANLTLCCQADDGAWAIRYEVPGPDDPRDDKASAIWAYQLLRLFRLTGDGRYAVSARRALAWCDSVLEYNPSDQGYGSMVNHKSMANVGARDLAVLYSTTYYGLAVLELMNEPDLAQPVYPNQAICPSHPLHERPIAT